MLEGNLTKLDGIVFVGQRGNLFLIIYSLLSVWWLIIIRFNGRSKIRSPNFLDITGDNKLETNDIRVDAWALRP